MNFKKAAAGVGVPKGLTAERIDAWLIAAQPGARLIYYHGWYAAHGREAINQKVMAEEARGMIFLVQDRRAWDEYGYDYVAIRSSRPSHLDAPKRPPASLVEQAERRTAHVGRSLVR